MMPIDDQRTTITIRSTTALTWIEIESRDDRARAARRRREAKLLQLASGTRERGLLAAPRIDVRARHLAVGAERERERPRGVHRPEVAARLLLARVEAGPGRLHRDVRARGVRVVRR